MKLFRTLFLVLGLVLPASAAEAPRLVMFVGVDVSGSFLEGKHYEDSLEFMAHYLYGHLNGSDGLEVPHSLFVGSLGGTKGGEPKTFYPIQTFQHASIQEIRAQLKEMFPRSKANPITDYNAFFEHIAETLKNRKLILKPVSIVLLSDGRPDFPGVKGEAAFRKLNFQPLEMLSRNVTVRLLYTDAVTGGHWQNKIPRKRVKVWTQDANVMKSWKDEKIFLPGKPFAKQKRFFDWVKDNVDFGVRAQRVD
jgi:hypothetical protein